MASLTFRKEDTDSKTEGYSGDGVQYEEDKQHCGAGIANHSPLISVNTEEQQHDEHCDEKEEEVLDKPGQPVQPIVHTHHLHRFL